MERFENILREHGCEVILRGSISAKAFVQRLRQKKPYAPARETDLGAEDLRRWLYLGSKQYPLEKGDRVVTEQESFTVQDAAMVALGGSEVYQWALLTPERMAWT